MAARWSVRTDTAWIPVIDGEVVETREVPFPWTLPPVTTRYARRSRWQRFLASAYMRDVRKGTGDALAVMGGVGFLYLIYVTCRYPGQVLVVFAIAAALTGVGLWLSRSIDEATTLPDSRKETVR